MTKIDAKITVLICAVTAGLMLEWLTGATAAEKKYDPGVSDTEIRIGQTLPYSGPASAIGSLGRVEGAYYEMINAAGGVNGRKITLISLDDAYSSSEDRRADAPASRTR